jgi:hypothetical protein
MEHVGQLLSVNGRDTSKGTVFEADCGGKTFATWKEDVANKARGFIGQVVQISYDQKITTGRNGQTYENNYLNDIVLSGQQALAQPATRENATEQVASTPAGPVVVQKPGMPEAREQKIVRQSSLKTAFEFYGSLYSGMQMNDNERRDVIDSAIGLAAELYKLAWGGPKEEPKIEEPLVQGTPDENIPF